MAWQRFSIVLLIPLLLILQLVAGRCLMIEDLPAGAPVSRVYCGSPSSAALLPLLPLFRRPARGVDGRIQRLWLSRGSTSALMNNDVRELLDSTVDFDDDPLTEDIEEAMGLV